VRLCASPSFRELTPRRLEKLRHEVAQLETKHVTLDVQSRRLSLSIAKKQCLEFAKSFQANIPPELRDMVYAHVWDEATLERVFDDVRDNTPVTNCLERSAALTGTVSKPVSKKNNQTRIRCKGDRCKCFSWWELPLWVQYQFVGFEVAQEAAAAAYYHTGTSVHSHFRMQSLMDMLSNDLFHLDIKPADHLRCLELDLDAYRTRAQIVTLEQQLPCLLKLRLKKGFELVVKTSWHPQFPKALRILDKMDPIVTQLKQAGAIVRAAAWHDLFQKTFDVPDVFSLGPKQWQSTWFVIMTAEIQEKKREYRHMKLSDFRSNGSTDDLWTPNFNGKSSMEVMLEKFGRARFEYGPSGDEDSKDSDATSSSDSDTDSDEE
jgi:hypothetical protein